MSELFEDDQPQTITFDDLVGEGKKYRDPDAVAHAVSEKDRFIEQLKHELDELRTDLRSRTTLEEMLEKLPKTSSQHQPAVETPPTQRQDPGSENPAKEIDLQAEVQRILEERDKTASKQSNINAAKAGLKERFGGDYQQKLKDIAEELEVSPQYLTDIAAKSPKGFFKLIDSVAAPDNRSSSAPPRSAMETNREFTHGTRRNNAYYQELRRKDPNAYFSPKIQNELYKEAMAQGSKFFE